MCVNSSICVFCSYPLSLSLTHTVIILSRSFILWAFTPEKNGNNKKKFITVSGRTRGIINYCAFFVFHNHARLVSRILSFCGSNRDASARRALCFNLFGGLFKIRDSTGYYCESFIRRADIILLKSYKNTQLLTDPKYLYDIDFRYFPLERLSKRFRHVLITTRIIEGILNADRQFYRDDKRGENIANAPSN